MINISRYFKINHTKVQGLAAATLLMDFPELLHHPTNATFWHKYAINTAQKQAAGNVVAIVPYGRISDELEFSPNKLSDALDKYTYVQGVI